MHLQLRVVVASLTGSGLIEDRKSWSRSRDNQDGTCNDERNQLFSAHVEAMTALVSTTSWHRDGMLVFVRLNVLSPALHTCIKCSISLATVVQPPVSMVL